MAGVEEGKHRGVEVEEPHQDTKGDHSRTTEATRVREERRRRRPRVPNPNPRVRAKVPAHGVLNRGRRPRGSGIGGVRNSSPTTKSGETPNGGGILRRRWFLGTVTTRGAGPEGRKGRSWSGATQPGGEPTAKGR
uniref:Uncharacterized protein n=1 Tax=Arundo donax TaxID=35708 RepID=A0A0A9F4J8_ARUDO